MFLDCVLNGAAAINPTAGSLSIADSVSTANLADVYQFTLQQNSSLNLLASRLSGDVNIAIVQDKNGNGVVNPGEVLHQSANAGLLAEQLKVSTLLPGNYFVVVELGANPAANYTIELGATKSTVADILWRDFSQNQVGYWRFDGLQYMDTRTVTNAMDAGWQFEAIGDFDGDRAEDILWRHSSTKELVVWLLDPETATIKTGSGYIKQTATQNYMIPDSFRVAGVGDTNGDGKGDIIWRNESAQSTVVWYMNGSQFIDGGAVRLTGQTGPLLNDASWELVDTTRINDDAKFDIVWRNRTSNQVVNWIMDGNVITTGGTTSQRLDAAYDIESVGDFNGDGRGDLLWRDTQGNVQMWLVNAQYNNYDIQTLKLWNGTAIPAVGTDWKLVGVEDFSGDGKSDIVWRHQTGFLVLWTMYGATITQQSQTVSNTDVNNLSRQTLGTASKADFVDFGVQLAAAADSGISQSDWITNVRRSALSGVAEAGSQVNLFANDALIGTTTATTAGTWSIVGSALDDGVYTLSTRITSQTGFVMNQSIGRKLTIDGTAPDTQITGPIEGVGWGEEIELAGRLLDLDPETKVEYAINADGTLAPNVAMAATLENPTTSILRQKTIAPTKINLGPNTGTQLFKPYDVTLTSTDRAGNVTTQTYKGMRLNLPELTEDSILLPNNLMPTLPDARTSSSPNSLNNPSNTGGYLFIGSGGGWGYGTTGGTGAGGWNWNATATNPSPAGPPQLVNPDEKIGYLPALRLALTTARDVLSNHPATVLKKEALKQQLEMLMAVGEVVDTNGFYEAMQPMLQGVFATAYGATGGITRRQAVVNGWDFAKALAISPTLTGLQIFQANLYAVGLTALKQVNGTASQPTGLKAAIESLSTTYARLKPVAENGLYGYFGGFSFNNFMDNLWNNGRTAYGKRQNGSGTFTGIEQTSISEAITDLADHFRNQINPVKSLQFLDQTLQAATQVRQLHEDAYVQQVPAGAGTLSYFYSSSIRDAKFLRNLAELSFEIARVNPTVTAGANPTSEWIETLWEGGNIQSAAGGLSGWFSGFGAEAVDVRRDRIGQAMTYAGRLVQAAEAVDDPLLDKEVLKATVLSHLINLGGAYVALKTDSNGTVGLFLDTLLATSNIAVGSQELQAFLRGGSSYEQRVSLLKFSSKLLSAFSEIQQFRNSMSSLAFVKELISSARQYTSLQSELELGDPMIIDELSGFFFDIWNTKDKYGLSNTSTSIQAFLAEQSQIAIASTNPSNFAPPSPKYITSLGLAQTTRLWSIASASSIGDYGKDIKTIVSYYNLELRKGYSIDNITVRKPLNVTLGWLWVKAMIEGAETTIVNSDARKYDPMQVANAGDSLPVLKAWAEGTRYYLPSAIHQRLQTVLPTSFNNAGAPDYSGYPNRQPNQRMDYRLSISAGIAWLINKASITGYSSQAEQKAQSDNRFDPGGIIITGWTPNAKNLWESAIRDYNGGGVPNYWEKVESKYKELSDGYN